MDFIVEGGSWLQELWHDHGGEIAFIPKHIVNYLPIVKRPYFESS